METVDWMSPCSPTRLTGLGRCRPLDTFQTVTGHPSRAFARRARDHAADFHCPGRTVIAAGDPGDGHDRPGGLVRRRSC